jgi:PAS domain-containing protein
MNPFTQTGTTFDGLPGAGASGVGSSDLNQNFGMGTNEPPKDLKGKAIWFFETRFMPLFYNLNLKHEWQMICIVVVAAFVLGNLAISVYPLMQANRESLIKETARRARFMARQIADNNSGYLAARAETKTEVGSIENAEGVRTALLVDLDNRIIAPSSKMNQYLTAGHEATFAVKARDNFRAGKETGTWQENEDLVIAIEPVKVMSAAAGRNIVVAMAIVSLDSTLAIPDMGEMGMVYSETFIMTALLAALLFLILYKLTLKPFMALNEDMDKALKGDLTQVSHHYKFSELNALWDIINSAIQRIPRGGESSGGFGSATLSSPSEEFSGPLKMIGNLVPFGFVILDADKKILYLNSIFEEASGIRSDSSLGSPIADVARDQSMGPFIEDLFNRAPVGGEGITEDYELSGISYKVHGASFGMPGGTAKCLVMAVVKLDV